MACTIRHDTDMFSVIFDGNARIVTTVTTCGSVVEEWIQRVYITYGEILPTQPGIVIGFKIESDVRRTERVALIQLCIHGRCLIFRLRHANHIPALLSNFLQDRNFIFVGMGMDMDIMKLNADYPQLLVSRWIDLVFLAEKMNPHSLVMMNQMNGGISLENFAKVFMHVPGIDRTPDILFGNWNVGTLTLDQVKSACVYAYVSFQLGIVLNAASF